MKSLQFNQVLRIQEAGMERRFIEEARREKIFETESKWNIFRADRAVVQENYFKARR
jgi:hypothetical protein